MNTKRPNDDATRMLGRMNSEAQNRARDIILERRRRQETRDSLPWWKRMFQPSE